jgi:hypothetical protein
MVLDVGAQILTVFDGTTHRCKGEYGQLWLYFDFGLLNRMIDPSIMIRIPGIYNLGLSRYETETTSTKD